VPARRLTAGERLTIAATAAVIAGFIIAFVIAGRPLIHYFRHPDELRLLVRSWGAWAPLGIVVFQMLQVIVAPLPGNAMSFACGYAFGIWPTVVWLMVGILLGAAVDFLLVRLVGRRVLRFFLSEERLSRLDAVVLRRGTFYIFLLLLVPNPVGDWVYYLAGLTSMPLPLFLGLVFIARLPSNLLECGVGSTATGFGWREWMILGAVVVALGLVYYQFRDRIESLLDRITARRAA
jgi:uncharacterized membrane protein YdjX (TVP38/TMEM64 family)